MKAGLVVGIQAGIHPETVPGTFGCPWGITHRTRLAGRRQKRLRKKLEGGGVRVASGWVQARACLIIPIIILVF